ncbi:relaxase/mobilization nuclease domain-containing protein [Crossiella sp. CA198]|uniref:relaxase/mobilization nuclease domain-containing protein n=1 Tax=Crossiella sp. CA198 TaxID=3455607 RepID=UPI003F8D69BB
MIAKAPAKGRYGKDTYGLLRYLFGPGKSNEHTDPHLVAAWDPEWLVGGAFAERRRGWLTRLAREVDAPMTGHIVELDGGHVYHVVLSIPRQDGGLGDARWRELVEQAVDRMGFGPTKDGRAGCRWVAVHHGPSKDGNDHVHLAVNLIRGDGAVADTYRDWPRWRQWCLDVERRLGLTPTSPANKTAPLRSTRAEVEKAARTGRAQTSREYLRQVTRAAALEATSADEFIGRLQNEQMVSIEPRWGADGELTGYRVGLRFDRSSSSSDGQVWFNGSSLARDLSAPKLVHRWMSEPDAQQRAAEPGKPERPDLVERRLAVTAAEGAANRARKALAAVVRAEDMTAIDLADGIAHSTLGLLTASAKAFDDIGAGPLKTAAEAYELAAGAAHRVQPTYWAPIAVELRMAARRLARAGALSKRGNGGIAFLALATALASLLAEIGAWRELTRQRAQAVAARRAAALVQQEVVSRPERRPGARRVHTEHVEPEAHPMASKQLHPRSPAVTRHAVQAQAPGSGRAR